MAFTLNTGEFDLGAGFIGRGTILTGGSYAVGTATTGIQGLLNTSGLEGLAYFTQSSSSYPVYAYAVAFRASGDSLTGSITAPGIANQTTTAWVGFNANGDLSLLSEQARLNIPHLMGGGYPQAYTVYYAAINSSSTTSEVYVSVSQSGNTTTIENYYSPFRGSANWRFLARDHATALTHYPSTTETGSVFAASCVNSPTQWGLWIAGEVGDRSGYFDQTQGYFSIVILRNGSTWYISAFTPAAANSISRNDNVIRSFNIVPAPGQTGADRFSEFFIARALENGFSETIGKIPGFIYVDMNQAANSALTVGSLLEITPGVGTTYDLTNHGAIVVAQWGLDISATVSNVGSTFTVDTASTPSSASLSSLNRTRTTLEKNQRIQITATPPTGLSTATNYWVKNWDPTAFTFELSATEGGATIVPSSNTNSTITRYAGLIAMPCYQA